MCGLMRIIVQTRKRVITSYSIHYTKLYDDKVMRKYPDARIVIPGHGAYGNRELLLHTRELFQKAEK